MMKDKYDTPVEVPVSAELIERIFAQAIERGGSQCDPTSRDFRPDARAFWYKVRGQNAFAPITSRRFDTLHGRWQAGLEWGAEIQVSYHYLRHTISETLKAHFGPHYAKRYLRHAESSVTDLYGRCTTGDARPCDVPTARLRPSAVRGTGRRAGSGNAGAPGGPLCLGPATHSETRRLITLGACDAPSPWVSWSCWSPRCQPFPQKHRRDRRSSTRFNRARPASESSLLSRAPRRTGHLRTAPRSSLISWRPLLQSAV